MDEFPEDELTPQEWILQAGKEPRLRPEDDQKTPERTSDNDIKLDGTELIRVIVDLGTNLWRMKKLLTQGDSPGEPGASRRLLRHIQDALLALGQLDVEIIDHTGEELPETGVVGLKRLAFDPKEGLERETVIETIKPTITMAGTQLQMGEVIVGTPMGEEES